MTGASRPLVATHSPETGAGVGSDTPGRSEGSQVTLPDDEALTLARRAATEDAELLARLANEWDDT